MTSDRLASIPTAQRNAIESLLMEFDQSWTPDSIGDYGHRAESEHGKVVGRLAAVELVKIDLQRCWSTGRGRLLEEYLAQVPLLGAVVDLESELILAEFLARQMSDSSLTIDSYSNRFPSQFQQLVQLAKSTTSSNHPTLPPASSPVQASIETSRIGNLGDTQPQFGTGATPLPKAFGRYRIIRELGSGAMGNVYLAHDTQLDREVALKTPSFESGKDEELVARFYREARSAAKIQHRNICPIYDVGEIDGRHFITMAYIKGRPMSDLIDPGKLAPEQTTVVIVHRLAKALAEAHRHNVIHRDLKPANIMIDKKREPVVMDFGLARQIDGDSHMTQSGMIIGTPAYMSPEQLSGEPSDVGKQADIYALGVIFYELLTGQVPFSGTLAQVIAKILHNEPQALTSLRPELSPKLEAICRKMMAKKRGERYQSMVEVASDLKEYVSHSNTNVSSTEKLAESDSQAVPLALRLDLSDKSVRVTQESVADDRPQPSFDPTPVSVLPPIKSKPKTQSSGTWFSGPRKWLASGMAAIFVLAVISGIVFYAKTPYGTIRIETIGELDGLEVLVDGNTINLTASEKMKAVEHELQLKLGDVFLDLDSENSQFLLSKDGNERKISVTAGSVELSSGKFTVARNKETILRIELMPGESAVATKEADVETDTPRERTLGL